MTVIMSFWMSLRLSQNACGLTRIWESHSRLSASISRERRQEKGPNSQLTGCEREETANISDQRYIPEDKYKVVKLKPNLTTLTNQSIHKPHNEPIRIQSIIMHVTGV